MFSVIDSRLIDTSQKIIYTLEIHTGTVKKNIISYCVILLKLFSIFSVVFFLYINKTVLLEYLSSLFNLVLYSILTFLITTQQYEIAKKQEIVPKAILFRRDIRRVWIFLLPINIFFLSLFLLIEHNIYRNIDSFLVIPQLFLTVMIEYFLCTRSLPPKEREKHTQEKEMKYFIPQKI